MTGVEEVEDMTGIEDMTGVEDMKNDVRKERRAPLLRRLQEVELGRAHKSGGKLNLHS